MTSNGRRKSADGMLMTVAGLSVAVATVLVDQASKWAVTGMVAPGQIVSLGPVLQLQYRQNPSGAFGLFASLPNGLRLPVLLALGLVAVVAVTALSIRWLTPSRPLAVFLGLVLGGALSNLTDRLAQGHVVDFISLHAGNHYWPTFNLADTAITVGSLLLLWLTIAGRNHERQARPAADGPGGISETHDDGYENH